MHVKPYFSFFRHGWKARPQSRRTDDGGGEGGEGLSACEAGVVWKQYLNREEGEVVDEPAE